MNENIEKLKSILHDFYDKIEDDTFFSDYPQAEKYAIEKIQSLIDDAVKEDRVKLNNDVVKRMNGGKMTEKTLKGIIEAFGDKVDSESSYPYVDHEVNDAITDIKQLVIGELEKLKRDSDSWNPHGKTSAFNEGVDNCIEKIRGME